MAVYQANDTNTEPACVLYEMGAGAEKVRSCCAPLERETAVPLTYHRRYWRAIGEAHGYRNIMITLRPIYSIFRNYLKFS